MFVPLRYQITESDCYPTCLLNALTWLFQRHELPGEVLRRVYAGSLDGVQRGIAGVYTSEDASKALIDWLSHFKTRSFAITTRVLRGREVQLKTSSPILQWLRRGGVVVLDLVETPATSHSVLALETESGRLCLWDPYLRGDKYLYGRGAQRLASDGRAPNLSIPCSSLDSNRLRPYALGPANRRFAVMIRRTRRKASR